jgi:cytoskeletal protein RodZ
MKMNLSSKGKRVEIDKEQSMIMLVVGIATIITIFCLIGTKALLSQAAYQRRVTSVRHQTEKQITADISNANTLTKQFNDVFEGSSTNIIGGQSSADDSAPPPNGNNSRIVLDALPTSYDYPALLTSISKLLNDDGIGQPSITGSDQSSTADNTPLPNPQPVNIDVSLTGNGTYDSIKKFVTDLERSIRPINVTKLSMSGNESNMTLSINFTTYYQVAKSLDVTSKVVK